MFGGRKNKIPTTVFSGFLGSGKTTVISNLTDYLIENNYKVVYIKNEIGTEDIDGVIFKGKHITTRELLNGCICCTLTGSFYHALSEIASGIRPDRIMIEASGAADPSAIALLLSSHPEVYRDGVISIIDVVNFGGYINLSTTARRQAEFTDLIVFNKVELADMAKKSACVGYVRELNEFAPIVEAPGGKLIPDLAFGLDYSGLNKILGMEKQQETDHHKHLQEDRIEMFGITLPGTVDENKLREVLQYLPPNVIRIKGFIRNSGNRLKLLNKVGNRLTMDELPDPGIEVSKLVFIGFSISSLKGDIENKIGKI